MSSPFTLNYRRRSHSASSPSPSPAPVTTWRPAPKRAHSSHRDTCILPDSQRYSLDLWRTGKRLRRDFSPSRDTGSSTPSSVDGHTTSSSSSAPHTPLFPATSADFLLFQGRSLHTGTTAAHNPRSPTSFASSLSEDIYESSRLDLARLRSEAFSELQRSVEENGEGFIKRMREFEDSRSRSVQHTRPKGSDRRRRKRYSPSVPTTRATRKATISDDDDDVLILATDVSGGVSFYQRQKRSSSVGAMDESDSQSQGEMDSSGRLSPVSPISGITHPFSFTHSVSHIHPNINNHQTTEWSTPYIAYPESTSPHSNAFTTPISHSPPDPFIFASSMFSSGGVTNSHSYAPISSSPGSPHQYQPPAASIPTTASRTEKAIAALTLAMANGAGGLGDYEAVRALEVPPLADESQTGELWH